MTLKKITIAVLAASVALSSAGTAMAFPAGPGGFAQEVQPTHPDGPGFGGPGGFANPQGGGGGGGNNNGNKFNPALGVILGIGAIAATAAAVEAAQDDEIVCWKEKRKGKLVTVCVED